MANEEDTKPRISEEAAVTKLEELFRIMTPDDQFACLVLLRRYRDAEDRDRILDKKVDNLIKALKDCLGGDLNRIEYYLAIEVPPAEDLLEFAIECETYRNKNKESSMVEDEMWEAGIYAK